MKQKTYTLFHSQNVTYVLTECPRTTKSQFRDSDFLNQGLSLTGIAKPFETLEEVTKRFTETHERNMAVFFGEGHTSSNPVYARKKKPI